MHQSETEASGFFDMMGSALGFCRSRHKKKLPYREDVQARAREICAQLNSGARSDHASNEKDAKKIPFVGPDAAGYLKLVPVEVKNQLAANPNSYLHLAKKYQTNENVALCCIQYGVRATDVVMMIMTWCPSLCSHPMAWRLLICSAIEPRVFEFADKSSSSKSITNNEEVMSRAIQNCGPSVYSYLDSNLQKKISIKTLALKGMLRPDFGLYCRDNPNCSKIQLLKSILHQNDGTTRVCDANKHLVWKLAIEILAQTPRMHLEELAAFWQWASESPDTSICNDKEIMSAACLSIGGDQIQFASDRLRRDVNLLSEIIQNGKRVDNDHFLPHVPEDILLEHPLLIVEYLEKDGNTESLLDVLPPGSWRNRSIVECYLRKGGHPHDGMDEDASNDWDCCLAYVKGAPRRECLPFSSLNWICEDLCKDVSFLVEAAKLYAHILRDAEIRPFELILATAAYHGVRSLRSISREQPAGSNIIHAPFCVLDFSKRVKAELQDRENMITVLCDICILERQGEEHSLLNMLNSDIAEHVARFVGVPCGERLKQLRRALPVCDELFRECANI